MVFRDRFTSSLLTRRNGIALQGSPAFSVSGMVLDGSSDYAQYEGEKLLAIVGADELFVMIRFTPTFAHDDGSNHYLLDSTAGRYEVVKTATNTLVILLGGTLIAAIAAATYGGSWNVNQENVLIISSASGDTDAWLNGTQILTADATAWSPARSETRLVIGSANGGGNYFAGTFRELAVGNRKLDADGAEELDLRLEQTIQEIDADRAVLALPMKQSYVRPSDSLRVTEALGLAGVTEVLVGSDGSTAAEFPTKVNPRGFSFDGGDQLNAGDNDSFTFASGGSDEPFSAAGIIRDEDVATARSWFHKAADDDEGEYYVYVDNTARYIARFIDDSESGYRGRRSATGEVLNLVDQEAVLTYDGLGTPNVAGAAIPYLDGVDVDDSAQTSGDYSSMENTLDVLTIGATLTGVSSAFLGELRLFSLFPRELTVGQVRALTDRIRKQDRQP